MKSVNGGQRQKHHYSIKRVTMLITVAFIALLVNTVSGRGIQAEAADDNQIVKSGELDNITWTIDSNGLLTLAPKEGTDGHFNRRLGWLGYYDDNRDSLLVKKCIINGHIYADNTLDGFLVDSII